MANILLRSKRYEMITHTGMESAVLTLSVNGSAIYTVTKNALVEADRIVFEISELCRDYIEHDITSSDMHQTVSISGSVVKYPDLDGGGTALGTDTFSHIGYDGYGEFSDGINPTFTTTPNFAMQTNLDIYLPDNTASYIPINYPDTSYDISTSFADGGTITIGSKTFTVHRICDPKYDPTLITFVNKYGAKQEMYFFHVRRESLNVKAETFKRGLYDHTTNSYDTNLHQKRTFNAQGNETLSLNTDFVRDGYNEAIKELLLSEYVWATIDGTIYPVRPTTSSLAYKTEANEKLIQYTIDFEYANDLINVV